MAIEILGYACRVPSAENPEQLFELLRNDRCVVSSIPSSRWDTARFWHPTPGTPGKAYTFAAGVLENIYDFDPAVFGLSVREASFMDPQQRILLQVTWRALEDAGLRQDELQRERVGVYIGSSALDHGNLFVEDPASGSPHFMTGNTLSIIANRVSHVLGLSGPSMTIDTACSSSLVALAEAERALLCGEIDTAIVGGVNLLLHPFSFVGFSQARMLSPEGLCRAYGQNGEGYVRAEGAGVIILRHSRRVAEEGGRSRATIIATGMNSSGRTNGISLPSSEAQAALLRSVYEGQGIHPTDLVFIEGHGTGTRVGDPAEVSALGQVLGIARSAPLPIGSIKSNIGHAEPASGVLGLIKAVLALENDYLPASLHAEVPNQEIDFEGLNIEINSRGRRLTRDDRRRLAGVNSFGFGGTNVHVVIADPPGVSASRVADEAGALTVSAHTQDALHQLVANYADRFAVASPEETARIIAATRNRTVLKHRFAVGGSNSARIAEAVIKHVSATTGSPAEFGEAPAKTVKTAFVFAGNGSQWAGMGLDAYRENTVFRDRFHDHAARFAGHADQDLVGLLHEPDLANMLKDTRIAQPLLFAIQAALVDSLFERGVRPDVVFGHSVGEIAAAYAAGALSAADAATVTSVRSRRQHALAGAGTMAAVALSAQSATVFAASNGLDGICVAAVNSPNSVTVSGTVEEIAKFKRVAQNARIPVRILDIDYPFHHPAIDMERDAFLAEIPVIAPASGHTCYISTVSGGVLDGASLDAHYWWRNVREPVAFEAATSTALEAGCNLFVEISPRPILSAYIQETAKQAAAAVAVIPTLTRPGQTEGNDPIERSVMRALAHGFVGPQPASPRIYGVTLPPLPFLNRECRVQPTSDSVNLFGRHFQEASYTLLGWRTDPRSSVWKNHLDSSLLPDLAGHIVDGKPIMPGAAYIEIAVQAARQYFGVTDIEITNLEIFRPLDLRASRLTELSTRISPETGAIEIASREYLSEDGWTVHATARSRKSAGIARKSRIDPLSLGRTDKIQAKDAYETARRFGLDYAPGFQLLAQAELFGDKYLLVDLLPPEKPAHPWLSYDLNPISIDAAFHGLVAFFNRLTGDNNGAPYIPVRFGSVCCAQAGKEITRAAVEIQRFSANTFKARFELFAEDGTLVATLDDCRFRRTWLRQHKTLEDVSFHYQTIPVQRRAAAEAIIDEAAIEHRREEPGEATLLIEAAVLRASYDIASKLAEGGRVTFTQLSDDRSFNCFIASCMYSLEDAGLAFFDGDGWSVPCECDLPEFEALFCEAYQRFPERVAEIVLIGNVYLETFGRLANGLAGVSAGNRSRFLSEATLDHVRHDMPVGRLQRGLLIDVLVRVLGNLKPGSGCTILEAGAISVAFSTVLAEMAMQKGGRLVIVEPSDHLRKTLQVAFEDNPAVSVLAGGTETMEMSADIAVTAGGELFANLQGSNPLKDTLRKLAGAGGVLVAVEPAPSNVTDFIFGLTDNWFAQSASPEFPLGRYASPSQWKDLLAELGFSDGAVELESTKDGGLISIQAGGRADEIERVPRVPVTGTVLHILDDEDGRLAVEGANMLRVSYLPDGGTAPFLEAFAVLEQEAIPAIFVLPAAGAQPGSQVLQNHILVLSALAEATRERSRKQAGLKPARLVIVAPGGAPAGAHGTEPVASGVWTFAHVLQNEYEEIEIFLLDADPQYPETEKAVASLITYQGAEREWLLDGETGLLSVVRVVTGSAPAILRSSTKFETAAIRQQMSGRIDSIVWEKRAMPQPEPGKVVVQVAATGLNFRDVMWSMGLLPEEALEDGFAGATLGMEIAGTIVAVGQGVQGFLPGDRVMGIASHAFSTHVAVNQEGLIPVPDGISLASAATVPVAFLTAWYAMVELGRIRAGETILIHGAAGGVGLAALQVARLKGARVIATAGTVEKRRLLSMLGAEHVFDSRSLDFVGDVLNVTEGQGVDLVLNSLFAEAMERSFELVKPFGRFLELGKRDYYSDRKLALRPFRRNISYFGIDADQLLVKAPELTKALFADLAALFAEGKLTPLPFRAFRYDETASAFRLMQNAGHIGKIVVLPPMPGQDSVRLPTEERLALPQGVYLVVGGIGGFGLSAAKWLVERGATHVALATRKGIADNETLAVTAGWKRSGISSSIHACDVTDERAVKALLDELRAIGPLKGVLHAAMVLDDALIANLDRDRNRPVIDVKAQGASTLDRLTREDDLALFLLFSSATTMIGNPGQGNYVAANGYLEGLARARRAAGLPALAVGFGAIADTGFLARNSDVNDILSKRLGRSSLSAREALSFVERCIVTNPGSVDAAVVIVADLDWAVVSGLQITHQPLFSAIPRNMVISPGDDGEQWDLPLMISGKPPEEAYSILHRLLAGEIAGLLKVAEDSITPEKALKDIGLDSLMAMELGTGFQQKTGVDIPLSGMGETATVGDIIRKLYEKVLARRNTDETTSEAGLVEQLASKHMSLETE
ncbi:SDR family NAD(P)-dependent oxidoreductase [Rhizobium pusense]|uniref:type I polyketide synthase n=4 Tax=Agrobacterium pusense TaxID=648995 RepID=UPI00244834E6|nr:SDR family NAD(P)-dependent oxidoreductase [Agrobacterium pusense]MDH1098432.1 SDR family NAD(P)-dependent oxidoreductase [Agrobacterium pusense]MDH1114542.1 SDR family NAD(P)-dependent oxidoreductase [Agrobacterium pusense]MDH2195694.1 SDR family NAD(P)-dependent oxidoreductase [Agrobacterium pusense]